MKLLLLILSLTCPLLLLSQDTYKMIVDNNENWLKNFDIIEKDESTFYLTSRSISNKENALLGTVEVREMNHDGEVLDVNSFSYNDQNHLFVTHKNCSLVSSDNTLIVAGERFDGTPIVLFINESLDLDTMIVLELDPDFYLARNKNIIEVEDGYLMILAPGYFIDFESRPLLIKIDKSGGLLWKKRFLEDNVGEVAGLELYQYDDNIILHGSHSRPLQEVYGQFRSWILSIDKDGRVLWEYFTDWSTDTHTYEHSHISELIKVDQGWLLARTLNYFDTNVAFYPFNQNQIELWDNDFKPVWKLPLGEMTTLNNINAIHQISDEEFIATGQYNDHADNALNSTITAYATKFNIRGDKIWERQDSLLYTTTFGCRNISANSILTASGKIMHAGSTTVLDSNENEMSYAFIIKMDQNGCVEDDCPRILSSTEDVKLSASADVSVSPNPSNGDFVVQAESTIEKLKIYTTSGILVKTIENDSQQRRIDLSGFPAETYVLKARIGDQVITKKIIKQ